MYVTKEKQTHRYREQNSGYQWGKGMVKGIDKGMRLRDINYDV